MADNDRYRTIGTRASVYELFVVQPRRMRQTVVSLTQNLDLHFKWQVVVQAGMHEQVVTVFDTPWQVRHQLRMTFRKCFPQRIQFAKRHTVRCECLV